LACQRRYAEKANDTGPGVMDQQTQGGLHHRQLADRTASALLWRGPIGTGEAILVERTVNDSCWGDGGDKARN